MVHVMSSTIMHGCGCIIVHMGRVMDIAPPPSAQIRSIVAAALSGSGMGQRRLEAVKSLPAWSLRGIMDPSREQSPSVDRAAEILAALGYELVIRPRAGLSGVSGTPVESVLEPAQSDAGKKSPPSEPALAPGAEPVPDRAIAEILAALADEYEALNGHGRESLRMQFWATHPHLRERARTAAGRRLARLAGGGGQGRGLEVEG